MDESEWLSFQDPLAMLQLLADKLSPRKRQLFACACVRRVWEQVSDATCRRAVEVAERYGDGLAAEGEREAADIALAQGEDGRTATYGTAELAATFTINAYQGFAGMDLPLRHPAVNAARFAARAAGSKEAAVQAAILRDIAGNPFRLLPAIDPAWLARNDRAVAVLARCIYDERAFDRMPELAAALEAAGCPDAALLGHLRGEGPHVRGCHVIDALLGKE